MHKEAEMLMVDMIVKSKHREGHVLNLWRFFLKPKKYNTRLKPQKSTFRVTSGQLLEYIVSLRVIKVDC